MLSAIDRRPSSKVDFGPNYRDNRVIANIAPTPSFPTFDNSFRAELPELATDWHAEAAQHPQVVILNYALAEQLGINPAWLGSSEGAAFLTGNNLPPNAKPAAMAYAGHQFGHYSARLGDGRALLVGELVPDDGQRLDLHLKGSGRTPFARGGDGKAALGPMLREYLMAEAMNSVGIPTSRALAVTSTGNLVIRDGSNTGAVLARVASSHIRVGTFQYAAALDAHKPGSDLLKRLADYSIGRHYPHLTDTDKPYVGLLDEVIDSQARLVAQWMLVGFIHGVMNTDNMTICAETIDYGPCAFMDSFNPSAVFSSIDTGGRYAYDQQPGIAQWNLARLAEALLPLIDSDQQTAIDTAVSRLERFADQYRSYWVNNMRDKLGLSEALPSKVGPLADDLLSTMQHASADFTLTFRALSASLNGNTEPLRSLFPTADDIEPWLQRWHLLLDVENRQTDTVAESMDRVNPLYIPRNHLVEEALVAAEQGDLDPVRELDDVLRSPYEERKGIERYTSPAPPSFTDKYQTFCGT